MATHLSLRQHQSKVNPMTLPNFLIVGAAKSGTSALYNYLREHPQVFMPNQKELRYFSSIDHQENNGPDVYKFNCVTSLEEYKQHFSEVNEEIAIGEASPQYLYYPETASHINKILPNIKIIIILRNPVERAYSAYLHALRDWHENEKDFLKALHREDERIAAGWPMLFHYVHAGFYYHQLLHYFKLFPRSNIQVIIYDDFVKSPNKVIKDLFIFLGVEENYLPNMAFRPNVSGYPKNIFIHRLLKWVSQDTRFLNYLSKAILPKPIRLSLTKTYKKSAFEKKALDDVHYSLLFEKFRDEIIMLERLLKKDLSNWSAKGKLTINDY